MVTETYAARAAVIEESMFQHAVESSRLSPAALWFIIDALDLVDANRVEFSARDVCVAVAQLAWDFHGSHAARKLRELHLKRSEDVGRAVFALVEAGLLEPSPGDAPPDFAGLGRLVDLRDDDRDMEEQGG